MSWFFLKNKNTAFYELFQKHAECALEGARVLGEFLCAPEKGEQYEKIMKEVEREGDRITRKVHELVDNTFIPPFDHQDICDLITKLDDVLDAMYTIVNRMVIFRITNIHSDAHIIFGIIVSMLEKMREMIILLGAIERMKMRDLAVKIKEQEEEADDCRKRAIRYIFSPEHIESLLGKNYDARKVADVCFLTMQWKEVIEIFEKVTDRIQYVADVITDITLKNSVK